MQGSGLCALAQADLFGVEWEQGSQGSLLLDLWLPRLGLGWNPPELLPLQGSLGEGTGLSVGRGPGGAPATHPEASAWCSPSLQVCPPP